MSLNSKLYFFLAIFIYRFLLEFSYVNIIVVNFGYEGYFVNFSFLNYLISWFLFFAGFIFIKDRLKLVSDYFFLTAFLSVCIPIIVVYGYDENRNVYPLIIVYISIFIVKFITVFNKITFKNTPYVKGGTFLVTVICLFFVSTLIFWYFFSGVKFNIDFSRVYDFRQDNAELSSFGLLAYTNNWTHKIFNMTLFSMCLLYRRFIFAFILFIVQFYFFAASAHKGVIFLPFMVLGIWYYLRNYDSSTILPISFSVLILFSLFSFYFINDLWLSSLLVRRIFLVPAHLNFIYYEFFYDNLNIYWSNSILSNFLNYPYDVSVSKLIGSYLGKPDMVANNGFFSTGFAHAGVFGVFFYSFIIGFILRLIDDLTYKVFPLWFAIVLTIIPLRNLLISADLFTVLLTHGLFLPILIIFLLRKKGNSKFLQLENHGQ